LITYATHAQHKIKTNFLYCRIQFIELCVLLKAVKGSLFFVHLIKFNKMKKISDNDIQSIVNILTENLKTVNAGIHRIEVSIWSAILLYMAIINSFLIFGFNNIDDQSFDIKIVVVLISFFFFLAFSFFIFIQYGLIINNDAVSTSIEKGIFKLILKKNKITKEDLNIDIGERYPCFIKNMIPDERKKIDSFYSKNRIIQSLWCVFKWKKKDRNEINNIHKREGFNYWILFFTWLFFTLIILLN